MTNDQWAILAILAATVAMFLWGRWRHDMVAIGALLACVLAGLIAPAEAFSGFGRSQQLLTASAVRRLLTPSRSATTTKSVSLNFSLRFISFTYALRQYAIRSVLFGILSRNFPRDIYSTKS
jgi:di/tricarboxylate transporter